MTLLNPRDQGSITVDDQSPTTRDNYVGNWTKQFDGNYTKYYRGTYTATSTPGDSFSFTFTGTQAWLYGGLFNTNVSRDGRFLSYPTADYLVDGEPVGPKVPYYDSIENLVYFRTENLPDGPHKVNVTVTAANQTNPFIIDSYFYIFVADSPSPTPNPNPPNRVGTIVGGAVGGLAAICILIASLLCFLRRGPRGAQNDDFERPNPVYAAPDNYPIEPYEPAADMTQHTISDNSNLPFGPSFRPSGIDSFQSQSSQPGGMTQYSTRKAVLIAQPSGNVLQPVQHDDSGIRFSPIERQEPARRQSPPEIPPTYTHG